MEKVYNIFKNIICCFLIISVTDLICFFGIYFLSKSKNIVVEGSYILIGLITISCICFAGFFLDIWSRRSMEESCLPSIKWIVIMIMAFCFVAITIFSRPTEYIYKGRMLYEALEEYPELKENENLSWISNPYDCYWDTAVITIKNKNSHDYFSDCNLKSYAKNPEKYEIAVQYTSNTKSFNSKEQKTIEIDEKSYCAIENNLFVLKEEENINNAEIYAQISSMTQKDGYNLYQTAIKKETL